MPEQTSLPGFEPAPKPTDSLFFAVLPSPDAVTSVGGQTALLRDAYGLRGSPLLPSRLHVSLINIGLYAGLPKAILEAAMAAAASVRIAPFELAFHRALSFGRKPNGKPLVLTSDDGAGFMGLQQALGALLHKANLGKPNPTSQPHVTMLYDHAVVPDQPIDPIAWTVREFVLIHSMLGQTRHHVLGRWPLQP